MNKKIYIVLIVIFTVLCLGTSIAVFLNRKNVYSAKIQEVNDQISQDNNQLTKLESDKDVNNYLPSDVVRNFMNELKNDSKEKAKLYVAKAKVDQDFAVWLKITDPLTQLNTTNVDYTVLDNEATVSYEGYVKEETNTISKVFTLIKEESVWKINNIEGN